jgi:hypothetical protein
VTIFPSVLYSPPPFYRNRRTPPIDSQEVPFPKCAFRQSPQKNNRDIACENKNRTSLSSPYLSFYQVLDRFSGISLLLRPLFLPFSPWIRYLKPSSRVKCSLVSVCLQIIHHNVSVGLTNTNKHFWWCCRGETVKREHLSITNLVPYFSLDFIFFLSSHLLLFLWGHLVPLLSILSCTPKWKLWPLETLDLNLTSGHELPLRLVEMIMKQSFLGVTDENSSLQL